jgi:hypothetical protein
MLDELADLEHDRKINRITYMIMAKDPEKTMQDQFEECRRIIKRNAPRPEGLISLMDKITSKVIQASKSGEDIEKNFFSLG